MNKAPRIYMSDKEIAPLVGLTVGEWAATALVLEKHGLPRCDPLFNDRRCWPAVEQYLIERARPTMYRVTTGDDDGFQGFKSGRATRKPAK
jgi:hypothetical protein